ncbi:hypothetical protein [Comamonas testosteroni]|mgnify:CR=1 FL=1|jgi:hypothetical protein|uniref:hypothetical protein n=1 Tax=Comamonas testosteroni TaxID=285 RepID=UPI0026F0D184|nr:hypothetical protein [Comamonas testosteroni]
MLVERYRNSSTSANVTALINLLGDPSCKEVMLFATPSTPTADFSESDGPENNLPLVAAVAKYAISGITDVYVLFDGLFLTAARRPRFLEVQDLMDVAQDSDKATFFAGWVPFTSAREPSAAVESLLALGPRTPFTKATRAQYFALLCDISEAKYP